MEGRDLCACAHVCRVVSQRHRSWRKRRAGRHKGRATPGGSLPYCSPGHQEPHRGKHERQRGTPHGGRGGTWHWQPTAPSLPAQHTATSRGPKHVRERSHLHHPLREAHARQGGAHSRALIHSMRHGVLHSGSTVGASACALWIGSRAIASRGHPQATVAPSGKPCTTPPVARCGVQFNAGPRKPLQSTLSRA